MLSLTSDTYFACTVWGISKNLSAGCVRLEFVFECVFPCRSDSAVLPGILHFPGWIIYSHHVRNAADTR